MLEQCTRIKTMKLWFTISFIFGFLLLMFHAEDTVLKPGQSLGVNESLVSVGSIFKLGFFNDSISGHVFLGIWFMNDVNKKPIWVANRENPMWDSFATLCIRTDGNLVLLDRKQSAVIVNSGSLATSGNTSATILDSGKFVLRQGDEVIWQSFDYPSDTYLPGMKIGTFGLGTKTPRHSALVSWLSPENPSNGLFTLGFDSVSHNGSRGLSVWYRDSTHVDIGSWDGRMLGFIFKNSSKSFNFTYVTNEDETYYIFTTLGPYELSWLTISSMGSIDEYTMSHMNISSVTHSLSENSTQLNLSPCLEPEQNKCTDGDAFIVMNGSLPTSMLVTVTGSLLFAECQFVCQSNCSCIGFAFLEHDQKVCQLCYGNKSEVLANSIKGEGVFYVRGAYKNGAAKKKKLISMLASILGPLMTTYLVSLWCYRRGKTSIHSDKPEASEAEDSDVRVKISALDAFVVANNIDLHNGNDKDLTMFSLTTIQTATEHFSTKNKLGEGGFGPVFKGTMPSGQEIAVKRLSERSGQGLHEFKNEVTLISNLQHINLVRLLGCCIQGDEHILIYEYMPNKSLDSFIFDSEKRALLDWKKRIDIIEGIAQGLLYLHKYSRLKIIHRDLKASNILLDCDLNPKISDFGMAKTFGENETLAQTTRIAGTYGYMSPEYATDGFFSDKSDVFSFGIVILEIISGQKNMSFFEYDQSLNLIGHTWNLWKEGKIMELVDPLLWNSCTQNEIIRCIQLGLLCVQDRAADRPSMSDVIHFLRNDTISIPPPKEPAFLCQIVTTSTGADLSQSNRENSHGSEIMSDLSGR